MVTNMMMRRVISIRFSYPCTVTGVLADGMLGVSVEILSDETIGVDVGMTSDAIFDVGVKFVVGTSCNGDVLADVLSVLIIDIVSAIDVGMLADESVNGLAAVMTSLEFTSLSP